MVILFVSLSHEHCKYPERASLPGVQNVINWLSVLLGEAYIRINFVPLGTLIIIELDAVMFP